MPRGEHSARCESVDALLARVIEATPPRAGSFIVSVFGDSISQHGNSVWLGSLIEALAPFRLNPRQIRTAVFRLVQDDWLSCIKIGRRSYYSFTDFGQRQYEKSARRIYDLSNEAWDQQWTIVMPCFVDATRRELLKRELNWLGFDALSSGVMAHPCANETSLNETIEELELTDQVVVMKARNDGIASHEVLKKLTHQAWDLDQLAVRFSDFMAAFQPIADQLQNIRDRDAGQMFEVQTLMIHEYRRIILKTTDLPDELLPNQWVGRQARKLAGHLYHLTREAAAAYLERTMEGPGGQLAAAGDAYYRRFTTLL